MSSNDDMWMSPGDGGDHFKMEEMTGVLSVNVSPDREKIPAYLLRVFAVDTANNTGTANVHVTIKDENDWTPTFLNETSLFNVTEGPKSVGSRIGLPIVDYDEGPNRQIEVAIVEGNTDKHFQLDYSEEQGVSGAILVRQHSHGRELITKIPAYISIIFQKLVGITQNPYLN
ncbi:hypothetical protein LAZ67_9002568 [Cordylochernes scorpioides]|uniref:Cadherin domain-containing protein n=1 Tax=Cordylochernes scorpioides TaxID=51811 RepID=A0ABY6KTY4_9ARAC|nr:hypothetical protein LAZ67_9002568 [Cordylochernes scorpioides]